MKKKIIYLVFLFFLTSGCSIEYNLEIDSNNIFHENFTVNATTNANYTLEDLLSKYNEEYPVYNDEEFMYYDPASKNEEFTYYQKTYQSIENGYAFNYKTSIPYQEFNRARTLKTVFRTGGVGYLEKEDYYYLSVSNSNIFKYNEDLDNVTINISFKDAEVLSHNAARKNGNTYTWYMTKDGNTAINVKYKLKKTSNPSNPNNPENPTNPNIPSTKPNNTSNNPENHLFDYILVGGVVLLFIIGIMGYIKYKSIRK